LSVPLADRPLAFLDTETTGLDPILHEIIEVAVVVEYPNGDINQWSTKVKPQHIENAQPEALAKNGYANHPEEWDDAPPFDEIAAKVAAVLDGCVLVGHNIGFDHAFIKEALQRADCPAKLRHHTVDTVTLAYEHLVPRGLTSLSFDRIRDFLGWSRKGGHMALKDALDCQKLYHELVGR